MLKISQIHTVILLTELEHGTYNSLKSKKKLQGKHYDWDYGSLWTCLKLDFIDNNND